jgi:hypothetical protein
MSATPAEFAHGLLNAFPDGVKGGPLQFLVVHGGVRLEIELTPGPDRVIALLELPTLRARLRFTAGDLAARARLLEHMDLAMHRGGG